MLLQIAWKNIWRNKIRSSIILLAIALGIFAGMFNMAFYKGMVDQRIETAISNESSHIQIHHEDYLTNPDMLFYIRNSDEIESTIKSNPAVEHISSRLILNAMASTAESGSGIKIMGIEKNDEKLVTDIHSKVVKGAYLEGIKRNPILIGEKLAEKLNLDIRKKVILTIQNKEGDMINASFRVAGIYKTSNTMYDEMNAFVNKEDLRSLINFSKGDVHEIAILLKNNEAVENTTQQLQANYSELDVKSWDKLMPEVGLLEQSMDISMYIFMGVILFALIFGIINTMLMAVLERKKELGMLMAIGMNKLRVFKMILLETVLLSITGGITGIILGGLSTFILGNRGINLSTFAKAYETMGMDTMVYPKLSIEMAAQVVIMVLFTGMLASLYPAYKALRLKPAEAIRIDI